MFFGRIEKGKIFDFFYSAKSNLLTLPNITKVNLLSTHFLLMAAFSIETIRAETYDAFFFPSTNHNFGFVGEFSLLWGFQGSMDNKDRDEVHDCVIKLVSIIFIWFNFI